MSTLFVVVTNAEESWVRLSEPHGTLDWGLVRNEAIETALQISELSAGERFEVPDWPWGSPSFRWRLKL